MSGCGAAPEPPSSVRLGRFPFGAVAIRPSVSDLLRQDTMIERSGCGPYYPHAATDTCVAQREGVVKALRAAGNGQCFGTPPADIGRATGQLARALRWFRLVPLALALSACAHQPLVTSCITPQQYEQLKASEPPKIKSRLHGKADEDIRIVTGSALELRSWGHALLDSLKICSEPKTTGAPAK